jgi:hypothetical protein
MTLANCEKDLTDQIDLEAHRYEMGKFAEEWKPN